MRIMTEPVNILIVVADALRADHLGCYGYQHLTSPHLDALAASGVVCERLFCEATPTQPSFTTLYTGQHPLTHGIIAHNDQAVLSREAPFLTELLLQAGYTTCAVDNLARARPWFERGYEFYIDPSLRHVLPLAVTGDELNARALPWLRAFGQEPFFMLVHFWDTHYPLVPPERYRGLFYNGRDPHDPANHSLERWWDHPLGMMARDTWLRDRGGLITDANYIIALYDQEIRYLDDAVGALIGTVDDLGVRERTLIVVMADHGESMTEHGIFFEHHGLYDCTTRVPFIMSWPGRLRAGLRLPQLLHSSDIAPSLLDAAELPAPESMDGRSFWGLATGREQKGGHERVITAECTVQAKWSLRTHQHRLILSREPDYYGNPTRELYDLASDPGEEHNIAEVDGPTAEALESELEDWIATRLRALGKTADPVSAQGTSMRIMTA